MPATPYPAQQRAIERMAAILQDNFCVLQLSSTGVGKTLQALFLAKELDLPVLAIAPKKTLSSWRSWAGDICPDLFLGATNPEQVRGGKTPWFSCTKKLINGRWHFDKPSLLVFDEPHLYASGPKSLSTRMIALSRGANVRVVLQSATLIDSPLKCRAVGYLTGLHAFHNDSFYEFCRKYGCTKNPFSTGLEFKHNGRTLQLMQELHERLAPVSVRLRAEDIPEFPETIIQAKLYDLPEHAKLEAIYESMLAEIRDPTQVENPMVRTLRYRQQIELLKLPLFEELVLEALSEDLSPVVFFNFRESVAQLKAALLAKGITPAVIIGGQPEHEQEEMMASFQSNRLHVALCTSAAGGVGINLHDILHQRERVTYINPDFNSATMRQTLGRVQRAQGTKSVQTFVLIANTVEEKVFQKLNKKLLTIDTINDGLLNPFQGD